MRIRGYTLLGVLLAGALATAETVKPDEPLAGAREAYELSDYGTAAQILQAAAAKDAQNAEIQLLLAKTYYELQEHDAAIARPEKAVGREHGNSGYPEEVGRTYGAEG